MYPISPLYADYLKRHDREFLIKAIINGEEYTNAHIVEFSIENSLTMSDGLEIGTAIPSKLTIKLRLKNEIPANARIVPYLAVSTEGLTWDQAVYPWNTLVSSWVGGSTEWLPLGEFFVDSREKNNNIWTFTCYDKLVTADIAYISQLTYPTTMKAVWDEICSRLGFTYDSSVVINPSYRLNAVPAGYTCRQLLAYIAGANAASVFVSKDGTIKFKRFAAGAPAVYDMTTADYIRVKQTNPVKSYSRVVVTYNTEDELAYEAGTGDDNHTLNIENPLMTQTMVNNLQAALNGFSYLPVTMDARGFPHLEHGDVIGFAQQESSSWLETITTWQDTDIPWDGIVQYKTLLLHQVLTFKGGLKLKIEAPSVSEQKSEFVVEGSLTQQVNKLNKDAVKEGKKYYGASLTRTEGLVIDRDDGLSKAVFNSDELSFYANGQHALWFDVPNRKFKFTGTLEGVDGEFSGSLKAATGSFAGELRAASGTFTGELKAASGSFSGTITASTITGATITGSQIQTSVNEYPRAEMSNSSKMFRVQSSPSAGIEMRSFGASASPDIYFYNNGASARFSLPSYSTGLYVEGRRMTIEMDDILLRGYNSVSVLDWGKLRSEDEGVTLASVLVKNLAFDPTTRNLKMYSWTGALLAQVNIPAAIQS